MSKKHPFLSRKLLAAAAGVIFAGLAAKYPEFKPVLNHIEGIIMLYIAGQALVDHGQTKADAATMEAVKAAHKVTAIWPREAKKS